MYSKLFQYFNKQLTISFLIYRGYCHDFEQIQNANCSTHYSGKIDFYGISNKNESYTEITRATHSNQTTTLANKIGNYSKTSFIDYTTTNKIINNFSYVYFVYLSRWHDVNNTYIGLTINACFGVMVLSTCF